ncbi:non-canonical purine NTP pyrophosphatase [Paenibacillus flagellatus]|uniref:dITP/XTP pyrophosphatase n=1 Tax=Paenibacillus flagellatus TaxID=2211139 RepID=A0A2V5KMK1_9BACL|nr:non-canonical purine NTP pyrophosphatase [Paenibacillus flagellatus]PYI52187.1 non-canonical purine NTP pyrophosphatase [Paenibacillus flagellatus]
MRPNDKTEELIVATRNAGKTKEFAKLFEPLGILVRSLNDFPDAPDIVEDGETFADNAWKKARTIAEAYGLPALADDSGLCVDRLGGRPGVYSARYAGEGATDADNNAKLLRELGALGEPDAFDPAAEEAARHTGVRLLSPARFVCALALVDPAEEAPVQVEGSCAGYVIDRPLGEQGFGYDPLFFLPDLGATMAQLPLERKNAVSHRALALRLLQERLGERIGR